MALARRRVERSQLRLASRIDGGTVLAEHGGGCEMPVVRRDDQCRVPVGTERVGLGAVLLEQRTQRLRIVPQRSLLQQNRQLLALVGGSTVRRRLGL